MESLTLKDDVKGEDGSQNPPENRISSASPHQDQLDNNSEDDLKNADLKGDENATENSQYQLVLYDKAANGAVSSPLRRHQFRNQNQRVSSLSVGAFTVQCSNCFKWRLIPTMEKYEEIREHIDDEPFTCESGREWRPEMSCNDPPDITQNGNRVWAIDKPGIPRTPPGWQRILRIRGEGGTKFADVYYVTPTRKRLRSLLEVQRFLNDNPEFLEEGLSLSRFSFQIPKPLQENYVQKRISPRLPKNDSTESPQLLTKEWMPGDVDTEMHLGRSEVGNRSPDSPEQLKKRKS